MLKLWTIAKGSRVITKANVSLTYPLKLCGPVNVFQAGVVLSVEKNYWNAALRFYWICSIVLDLLREIWMPP